MLTGMNLRSYSPLAMAAIALLAVGCTTSQNTTTLAEVGPSPTTAREPAADTGTLVVFSAYEVGPPPPGERSFNKRHTDYTLVDANGVELRSISNQEGAHRQDPAQVKLSPGKYRVITRANGFGRVTVPVLIVASQTTAIHLEGGESDGKPDIAANRAVTLPDGTVVGWQAN